MGFFTLDPGISPEKNLSRYLYEIKKFPMLTLEEEFALARSWRGKGDIEACQRLVTSHLRLAAKIAKGYVRYGLPFCDLVAEGNIGILQAVKRFDPDRGFRLSTYAMWWIRAAIQEYVLHSWSMVKLGTTAAQKKLFFNLRRLKNHIQVLNDGDLPPEQVAAIARNLNVSKEEVISMNRRMAGPDQSLNAPLREDDDGEWQDWLASDDANQEDRLSGTQELKERLEMLASAMSKLSRRESHILSERRLRDDPMTLDNLSQYYGISRERVRQIEVKAFEKVRKSVRNASFNR